MMIDNEKDPTKIVSMTRFEYQMELDKAKLEQKAIDDAELAEVKKQRDEYYDELLKLRQQKAISIDKACEWLEEKAWIDGTEYKFNITDLRKAMEK